MFSELLKKSGEKQLVEMEEVVVLITGFGCFSCLKKGCFGMRPFFGRLLF